MKYLSVCSGIEAATVAWHPLGWTPVAFAEIETFPSAVLAHHYPSVPNWGDMTRFKEWPDATFDVLVGGTPCQSFSVAGLRKGLDDARGNLALTYLAILARYRPTWCCWENVPGVLSSSGGRDFGAFLGGLGQLGYGFAYRVLDAQFFGIPQRRRRVFVVGCLGGWQRAAAVLFDGASLHGHPAPRREAWQKPSSTLEGSAGRSDTNNFATSVGLVPETSGTLGDFRTFGLDNQGAYIPEIAPTLDATIGRKWGSDQWVNRGHAIVMSSGQASAEIRLDGGTPALTCLHEAPTAFHNRQDPDVSGHVTHPLGAQDNGMAVALNFRGREGGTQAELGGDVATAIRAGGGTSSKSHAMVGMAVRRLTPVECARLQGFPDAYLDIPYRGKPAADGHKYKALGNSMAVPVMRWIGRRLQMVVELSVAGGGLDSRAENRLVATAP